jgi:hypothetical protein
MMIYPRSCHLQDIGCSKELNILLQSMSFGIVGFEVFTAVRMVILFFWAVMPFDW